MTKPLPPVIGNWYSYRDSGDVFQVVALDEDSGTVEIQDFDGAVDELDFDEWKMLRVEAAAPPEDWSGPVDDVEQDDLGYTDLEQDGEPDPLESATTTWEEIVEDDDLEEIPDTVIARQGLERRDH